MNRTFWRLLLSIVTVSVLIFSACTSVSTEDIQGLLQAVEGKEMVITLDDGSTIRVTVADAQKAVAAQQLVGKQVSATVRAEKAGSKTLDDVKKVGEDQQFTGKIEAMGADTWVIGSKTFKVDANTDLDGGLVVGVEARVEFVTLPDGSLLAREIETDEQDDDVFKGTVQSISPGAWTIDGQAFKVDAATRIDQGIAIGTMVRVEFVTLPDGSLSAIEIETDQAQDKSQGIIESIAPDKFVIGGRTFKVNTATRLDDGLSVGVKARVEFITLADGSMLATEIETDEAEDRFSGVVESMTTDQWVVGGRSFKVTVNTRLDPALAVGMKAKVRFLAMTDGTLLATRIQEDRQGTSKEGDFTGNVESISATAWVIGGKTFKLTAATRIDAGLAVGSKARVRFITLADGANLASRIEDDRRGRGQDSGKPEDKGKSAEGEKAKTEAGEDLKFTGAIESIAADKWVIGGKTFMVNNATMLDSGLVLGAKVKVEFAKNADGSMTALKIETNKSVLEEEPDDDKGGSKGSGQDNKPGDDKSGKS